jgi:subtilisin family serine protease
VGDMKNEIYAVLIITLILFGCNFSGGENTNSATTSYDSNQHGNPEREIVVKVSDKISIDNIDKLINGTRLQTVTNFNGFSYVLYMLSGNETMENALQKINTSNEGLVFGERNFVYIMHDTVPADTYYANQYAPKITGCEKAWDLTTGSGSVTVAVIDTGINGSHEELASRVIAGYNFISNSVINAGANSDDNGHGSHVAGIIGAVGNNSKGIAGVAWQIKLMPVKIFDKDGKNGTISRIVSGIIWAANNGANVINMSLGGTDYSQMMADAVNYAVITKKITVVVSMGNDGCNMINYPAAYPGVIAVGSTNGHDNISTYSTTGSHISVSAPGENIYSLSYSNNSGYVYMSGTSMASPFVAGSVALLLSKDNTLLPAEIKSILEDSAVDKGAPGFDSVYGYGRVDVNAALNLPKRNNYGTIKVCVNLNSVPESNISVLLLDQSGKKTICSGLTSDGGACGTKGECCVNFVRLGLYKIKVIYNSITQTQDINLSLSEKDISFTYVVPMYNLNILINSSEAGTVTLNPSGGIYNENTPINITANANTGYSFDHWEGSCVSTNYAVNIIMNGNKSITAYYRASEPTFNLSNGTYFTEQNITISNSTPGASIKYTTDGSNPSSSNGTIYSSPISITGTTTIKAISFKSGLLDSNITTASYYIKVEDPICSPDGGSYVTDQTVTLTSKTSGATIRYTTDNTNPSPSYGTIYTGPITITSSTSIRSIAYKSGLIDSNISIRSFSFTAAAPTFSPSNNVISTDQLVTISSLTPGALIRYTTDDSYPTSSVGTIYTEPITISKTSTIKAIAYLNKTGWNASYVTSSYFSYFTANPVVTPLGGYYTAPQSILITTSTPGATIRYTTDGTLPTSTYGTIYTNQINISDTTIIKAIAYKPGCLDTGVLVTPYVYNHLFYDDFESGNFSKNPWILDGNVIPIVESSIKYQGSYAVQLGRIASGQKSNFSIEFQNTSTVTISFYYKVSSDPASDYFYFIVDGTTIESDSGESSWRNISYSLAPGNHVIKWQFSKIGPYSITYSDTAWVDNILIY